jgi:acyl dehydratase
MSPTRHDLAIGEELPPFTDQPLTVTDFVRYQGASGDMNPIHHDTEFAQHSGFPTPFAVGMLQAGVLATYLTDRFGASAIRRFKVQWKEQAWPGDVLTYSAVVVGTRQEAGQSLVDLEASVTRQTGGVHLLGWATFVVQ